MGCKCPSDKQGLGHQHPHCSSSLCKTKPPFWWFWVDSATLPTSSAWRRRIIRTSKPLEPIPPPVLSLIALQLAEQEAMDLNKIVTTIQGLSGSEADLKQLKTQLTKAEDAFTKNLGNLDDALSTLDPSRHSLGWLFILYAYRNLHHKLANNK